MGKNRTDDGEKEKAGWWRQNLTKKHVFYPVLGAIALAIVAIPAAIIKCWVHQRVGFDSEGRPIALENKQEPKKEGAVESGTQQVNTGKKSTDEPRQPVKTADAIKAIAANLGGLEPNERAHRCYLSLAALHNDPDCSGEELAFVRTQMHEVLQHLAPSGGVVRADAVDAAKTVYCFDWRELGVDSSNAWSKTPQPRLRAPRPNANAAATREFFRQTKRQRETTRPSGFRQDIWQ